MTEENLGPSADAAATQLPSDRLRFALGVGRTGVWCWDGYADGFSGDRGLAVLWGLAPGASLSTALLTASLHPDDLERTFGEFRRAAAADGPDHCGLEFRIHRSNDGAERWIALDGRRYPAVQGSSSELIGIARDITARKQREMHMHLLMREVTHRSKNLLAIIQAMARQTVKDSLTADEFEQRFSARLRGLAASHDLLAARDWHGAAVDDLVRWQIGPILERESARIAIDGPALYLNPEAAQNIGLAINELSSNAARFGALSVPQGRVRITWAIETSGAESRRFRILWEETGGPAVAAPQRTGFGHKVVERLAARALDGEVNLTFAETGLNWSLSIPMGFLVDEAAMPRIN